MIRVNATEFQRNADRYQVLALTQPVTITRNGRERTVLISIDEYLRLTRRDREVLTIDDFSESDLEAIERATVPPDAAAFNHELEE